MTDIAEKAKAGLSWMTLSQFVKPGWEFVVGIVLARMLAPEDFGIVAMGMIFFNLAFAISNFGIANALVQKENLTDADIRTSQTMAVVICGSMYVILFFASYFFSGFFNEPVVGEVLRVFSIVFLINAFIIIPFALLTKDMQFKTISLIEIFSSFVYGFSALIFAYFSFGLWSLVYAPVLSAGFRCVVFCFSASYFPKFGWNRSAFIGILKFGGPLTVASIVNNAARNVDFFIIGKFLGAAPLGIYKRAYDLAVIPKEKVADSFGSILFPFLCKIRDDSAWTKSTFMKSSKTIALICVPVLSFCAVSSSDIIRVLYGEKWVDSILAFQLISIGGIFYCLVVPFVSMLLAHGKINNYLVIQVCYCLSVLIGSIVGVNYGIEGVSIGVTISLCFYIGVNFYFLNQIISLNLSEYVLNLRVPFFISSVMVLFILISKHYFYINSVVCTLLIKVAIAALVNLIFLVFHKDSLLKEIKETVLQRVLHYKPSFKV